MTNAEFRCYSGRKIFFKNDAGYKLFTAADLNTNVLIALGTSADKLDSQQAALEAANQKYKDSVAAYKAEQERQKQLQIQRAMIADAEAQRQYEEQQAANAANPHRHPYVTDRESVGVGAP